jgi:hypothetical protein
MMAIFRHVRSVHIHQKRGTYASGVGFEVEKSREEWFEVMP